MAAAARRSGYRWTILAIGVVAQASFSAVFLGIPVLAPALRADHGLTLSQVGVVIASVSIGILATVFPWGIVADRLGERIVIGVGPTLAGAALAQAAAASSFEALAVALAAAGAFGACVQAASGRAVMQWFDVSQRVLALGIRQTAVVVGGAPPHSRSRRSSSRAGPAGGLGALAVAALVAALASALGLREAPGALRREAGSTRATLRDARLWRLCGGSALLIVAQVAGAQLRRPLPPRPAWPLDRRRRCGSRADADPGRSGGLPPGTGPTASACAWRRFSASATRLRLP